MGVRRLLVRGRLRCGRDERGEIPCSALDMRNRAFGDNPTGIETDWPASFPKSSTLCRKIEPTSPDGDKPDNVLKMTDSRDEERGLQPARRCAPLYGPRTHERTRGLKPAALWIYRNVATDFVV